MTLSEKFTIEYASPGLVRAGRFHMTDFCVEYKDPHVDICFVGEGIWQSDGLVGYEIRLPKELGRLEPEDARAVWERVRAYVLEQNNLHWGHRNLSMHPFAEVWDAK